MATPFEHYTETLKRRLTNRKTIEKRISDINNQTTLLRNTVKLLNEDMAAILDEVEGLLEEMKKG